MKLVVLMTLVAVAIGRPPPCDDYCRTMWFSTQLPPSWDPLCDCAKRPPKMPSKTFNGKPVYTATTIFKLDDTGIYFDPANMHQVHGVTYINQPFYIVNSIDDFLTKPPITAKMKATSAMYTGQQSPKFKTLKYKRKYNVNLADSNTHKSFSYSYHKEDVPAVKANHKAMDPGSIEDLHKIGQSLSKCVDLYMVTVSRIYNNGSELAKLWGKSKYYQFSKLSDEDLIVTIQQECNETENFVKKSIEEIKDKHPKKKVDPKNEGSKQVKQNKPFLEPNYVAKAESEDTNPGNYGGGDHFKISVLLGPEENNNFPIPPIDKSDASDLLSMSAQNPTTPEIIPSDEPNINEIDLPLINNNERNVGQYHYLNNLTIYKKTHRTNLPDWVSVNDLTTAIEVDYANKNNLNRAIEIYPNSTLAAQHHKDGLERATIIYAKNRPTYNENEVPPQRVFTREFAKGLVQSIINGTEELQRDDATDNDGEDTHNPLNAAPIGPPITVYRSGGKLQDTKMEIDDQQIPLLIGNLYFRFGEDYIPAEFVQKSDGKLHVTVDGTTICAKINVEGYSKSPVLSGICDKFPRSK